MKKRVFKIKRTEGVGVKPNCDYVKYISKSRIDDYPMFSLEYDDELAPYMSALRGLIKDALIVNTRPGYTVSNDEIEWLPSIEDHNIPVQPMGAPLGTLFYIDYVYGTADGFDERLLLLM
jgi:hypothetical protein